MIDSSAIKNWNVSDKYKLDRLTGWTKDLIREDVQKNTLNYAVMMENWLGDFNLASLIRSGNAFGVREMFYLGRKHYDRRGTVGTHLYTNVNHLKDREQLIKLKEQYELVAIENTVSSAVTLADAEYSRPPLFILGEEGVGITQETLELCDKCVFIPMRGSVRSLNAAVAGSIIMNDFVAKHSQNF